MKPNWALNLIQRVQQWTAVNAAKWTCNCFIEITMNQSQTLQRSWQLIPLCPFISVHFHAFPHRTRNNPNEDTSSAGYSEYKWQAILQKNIQPYFPKPNSSSHPISKWAPKPGPLRQGGPQPLNNTSYNALQSDKRLTWPAIFAM